MITRKAKLEDYDVRHYYKFSFFKEKGLYTLCSIDINNAFRKDSPPLIFIHAAFNPQEVTCEKCKKHPKFKNDLIKYEIGFSDFIEYGNSNDIWIAWTQSFDDYWKEKYMLSKDLPDLIPVPVRIIRTRKRLDLTKDNIMKLSKSPNGKVYLGYFGPTGDGTVYAEVGVEVVEGEDFEFV